jgi:hypothetical protein
MTEQSKLSFEQLVDWVEGRLPAAEADAVALQVEQADAEVQAQVMWLRAFTTLHKAILLAAPPAEVRRALQERFADQHQPSPSLWSQLRAALRFDSTLQPAVAGLRGEGDALRQWVFATEHLDIALNLQPRPVDQRLDLLGQLLPNDESLELEGFVVELWRGEKLITLAAVDDLGEFAFAALEPGLYRLVIADETSEIELDPVDLTPVAPG